MNRNASSVTLMSGLGSYTSLFPRQCTPVILFVFLDDIHETGPTPDESPQSRSSNQSTLGRINLPSKGSGSIVVLSRPVTKSRRNYNHLLKHKFGFQSKNVGYYSGQKRVHPGSRNGHGPISNHLPLFSLDGSKAVLLLDKLSNNSGESLDFATSIVKNVLEGISTSDSLLLENHSQSSNKKYILSLKEFIYKQCDILRGRMSVSVSSGGGGGGGMVAAAAAASVALGSRKSCNHQRHDSSLPHCSGFVFLHACACGRSRKLRLDPFDFETANVSFSCYPECDKLLPTLILPQGNNTEGPIQSKSWSLTRIGGSRYYQPSKGLLQSGFSNIEKIIIYKFWVPSTSIEKKSLLTLENVNKENNAQETSMVNAHDNQDSKKDGIFLLFMKMGLVMLTDHLKGLGSIYAVDESVDNLDRRGVELSKIDKHGGYGKVHRHSNRMVRNPVKSKEIGTNGNQGQNGH
ncbi:hypothetical protein L2E82_28723 [Cichorium intybus]|uniref:Uncharacterized protein n=1 Tax=Cichorium intybus TaxID=13427 RepID=A0ACB9CWU8_CICIN|nr:hypothetical protein L2E82_28723 [Cichorium intybus]